ncbi:MAG: DNA/RNA non-specific endonuclease [Prevotella sp.]
MKIINKLSYLLLACITFSACGSDSEGEGGGDNESVNVNGNTITNEKAVTRLEMPKLKGGNSKLIVYRTSTSVYDNDRVNFCVEWDCDKKSQRWSAYTMHTGYNGSYSRVSSYINDNINLTTDSYYETDYYFGSGYDHGHICPNADRGFSEDANYQTYYMTNMQPQFHKFNGFSTTGSDTGRGLWVRLEETVRKWTPTLKTDTLYLCKGGTIDSEDHILTRIQGKQIVPKYFFMACLMKVMNNGKYQYKAIGFLAEHVNQWATNDNLGDYAVTIDELEKFTGIDFFCNLPDDIETLVESNMVKSVWGLK